MYNTDFEGWKTIKGYEGLYEVSNFGQVRSLNYNHTGEKKILKPCKNNDGYLYVNLCKNGKLKHYRVHRLVAQEFIENPMPLFFDQVNHINEDKEDNRVENLEWCDSKYNINYSKAIPVLQYTLSGELVREWPSVRSAEYEEGFDNGNIVNCCKGRLKSHKGFIWRYKKKYSGHLT